MKVYFNDFEFINVSINNQGGKMQSIPSISTNKRLNENCKKLCNSSKDNIICKKCYVEKTIEFRKDIEPCLTHNHNILTTRVLNESEIKKLSNSIKNYSIFRFESFGDLNNETQLINYLNIANACKNTKFGLFTKHYKIVLNYFKKGYKMPKNVTLILSSPFIDNTLNNNFIDMFKKYHNRVISFNVISDKQNPSINCGKLKCIDCRNCYDSKKPHDVIELLK